MPQSLVCFPNEYLSFFCSSYILQKHLFHVNLLTDKEHETKATQKTVF